MTRCFRCQKKVEGEVETVKISFPNGNEIRVPMCEDCRESLGIFSRSFDFWNNPKDDEAWNEERESRG